MEATTTTDQASEPDDVGCFGICCSWIIRIVCCPFIIVGCFATCCCYYIPYHAIVKTTKRLVVVGGGSRWDVITQTFVVDHIANEIDAIEDYTSILIPSEGKIRTFYRTNHYQNNDFAQIAKAHLYLDTNENEEEEENELLRTMLFGKYDDDDETVLSMIGYPTLITMADALQSPIATIQIKTTPKQELERNRVLQLSANLLEFIHEYSINDNAVREDIHPTIEMNTIYQRIVFHLVGTLYQLFAKEMVLMRRASDKAAFYTTEMKDRKLNYATNEEQILAESILVVWKMIAKDITTTIRAVVFKVVNDRTVLPKIRKRRVEAIERLGQIYCQHNNTEESVGDTTDEEAWSIGDNNNRIVSHLQETADGIMFETIRGLRLEEK